MMPETKSPSFGVVISKQLIETVQQYPQLYDPSSDGFKDSDRKQAIWDMIAAQFGLKNGENARSKWKNLRDSYVKYVKSLEPTSNESNVKKYEKWPYADCMEFLRPFILERRNIFQKAGNQGRSTPSQPITEHFVKVEDCDVENTYFDASEPDMTACYDDEASPPKKRAREDVISFSQIEKLDAVDLLMLSYAKTLKSFDKRLQTVTKMRISQIIHEAELEHIANGAGTDEDK